MQGRHMKNILRNALFSGCVLAVSFASAPAMAGCNSGNIPNTDLLTSANCEAAAPGAGSLAVGFGATSTGTSSVALGMGTVGFVVVADPLFGNLSPVTAPLAASDYSVAVGTSSTATGPVRSTAVGGFSRSTGAFSAAFGDASNASGGLSTA